MKEKVSIRTEIYQQVLFWGLLFLRNHLELPWYKRIFDRSYLRLVNLLHYIPMRMFAEDVCKQDVEFIELGVSDFIENYGHRADTVFPIIGNFILELYDLVNSYDEFKTKWNFPDEVRRAIVKYREKNKCG